MAATVYTDYGPGRIVQSETVRGRISYKVEAHDGGWSTWVDEKDLRTADVTNPAPAQDIGPSPSDGGPGMGSLSPDAPQADTVFPSSSPTITTSAYHEAWAPVDREHSVNLPYNPRPQYTAIPSDVESTIQPIHHIDPEERLRPSDSITFEDRSESEGGPWPKPNPDLFAKSAGFYYGDITDDDLALPHPADASGRVGPNPAGDASAFARSPGGGGDASGLAGAPPPPAPPPVPAIDTFTARPGGGGVGDLSKGAALGAGGIEPGRDELHQHYMDQNRGDVWEHESPYYDGPYPSDDYLEHTYPDQPTELGHPSGGYDMARANMDYHHGSVRQAGPAVLLAPLAEGAAAEAGTAGLAGEAAAGEGAAAEGGGMLPRIPGLGGGGGDKDKDKGENPVDEAIDALAIGGPGWGNLVKARMIDPHLDQLAADFHHNPVLAFRHDPNDFIERRAASYATDISPDMERYGMLVEADVQIREAAWKDVRAKAMRLRREGRVDVHDVSRDHIYANVKGDSGDYEVMILKDSAFSGLGGSHAVANWSCDCPWGQWAFKRKYSYIGRLCSHGYAAYLEMQSGPRQDKRRQPYRPNQRKRSAGQHDFSDQHYRDVEDFVNEYGDPGEVHVKYPPELLRDWDGPRGAMAEDYGPSTIEPGRHRAYHTADALQNVPQRLVPDLVVNDTDDTRELLDVTKDERETTGPQDILHFTAMMQHCDRNQLVYPRELVAFLERYADDETPSDWKAHDFGEAVRDLDEIRELSDRPQSEDFGNMDERNDRVRDAITDARDKGVDADQLVAMRRQAVPMPGTPGVSDPDHKSRPGQGGGGQGGGGGGSGVTDPAYVYTHGPGTPNSATRPQPTPPPPVSGNPVDAVPTSVPGGGNPPAPGTPSRGVPAPGAPAPPAGGGGVGVPNTESTFNPATGGGIGPSGTWTPSSDKSKFAPSVTTHTVQPGDTLSGIAERAGVDPGQLKAPGDNPNLIRPGDVINLPGRSAAPPGGGGGAGNPPAGAGGGADVQRSTPLSSWPQPGDYKGVDLARSSAGGGGGIQNTSIPPGTTNVLLPGGSYDDTGPGSTPKTIPTAEPRMDSTMSGSGKVVKPASFEQQVLRAAGFKHADSDDPEEPAPPAPGTTVPPKPAAPPAPGVATKAPGTTPTNASGSPTKPKRPGDSTTPKTDDDPTKDPTQSGIRTDQPPANPAMSPEMGAYLLPELASGLGDAAYSIMPSLTQGLSGLGGGGGLASGLGGGLGGGLASGLGGALSGLTHIFGSQQDIEDWKMAAFPGERDALPHDRPFEGFGPAERLQFTDSASYVDDNERPRFQEVTERPPSSENSEKYRTSAAPGGIKRKGSAPKARIEPELVREIRPKTGAQGEAHIPDLPDPYSKTAADFRDDDESAPMERSAAIDDPNYDPVRAFHASGAAQELQAANNTGGRGRGSTEYDDIAAAANAHLQKTAGRHFSPAEQAALIREGDIGGAGNLGELDLAGTHYEAQNSVGLW